MGNLQQNTFPPFPTELGRWCNKNDIVIVVYCRSGARANVAISNLLAGGYEATLYNGGGTNDWLGAGFDLVQTDSILPSCAEFVCRNDPEFRFSNKEKKTCAWIGNK